MADVTAAVAASHQKAPHQTGHSTRLNAAKRKEKHAKKYDPAQPRDTAGRWSEIRYGGATDFDKAEYDRVQLAHDTENAIFGYVQGGARSMNDTLRRIGHRHRAQGATWDQDAEIQDMLGREPSLLDAHMKNNTFTEDTTLTRTLSNFVLKGLEVGDIYQDDGYVSTTKNPSNIEQIRKDIGAKSEMQTTMTVLAPKGLGHIDVNAELGAHGYDNQEEVILPRGTKFQVVSKGPGHMTVKVVQDAHKLDLQFVNVLRWD